MEKGFLINRIKLQFDENYDKKEPKFSDKQMKPITKQLSAVLFTDNGKYLWVAADEEVAIERLERQDSGLYNNHQRFALEELLENFQPDLGEVDIEGLDYDGQYLWFVGSHSSKRKKAKGDQVNKEELTVSNDQNRYLLARIPLDGKKLEKSHKSLHSAYLPRIGTSNELIESLAKDPYLKDFITVNIPGKDNGLDIEGMVVHNNKIILGLRGPVLRGVAILVELEVEEKVSGILNLKSIGDNNRPYKLHFLDLNGLGIRELCLDEDNLLILAGPTMDLDGSLMLFRLKDPFALKENSFTEQDGGILKALFEIPHTYKSDRAEGITIYSNTTKGKSILVVYDTPNEKRFSKQDFNVFADVFSLP